MKKTNVLLILLLLILEVSAQPDAGLLTSDTIFYRNENGFITRCARNKADGFSISQPENSNLYVNRIYYLQTNTLMVEYEMYNRKVNNARNDIRSTLSIKNGKYEEWYISGEKRVSCSYVEDKLHGQFKVFHRNGNIKRLEQWKNGEWQDGECFDELGNKTEYCSYQEMAEFMGGLPELFNFISKTLVYPKHAERNGIQGRVYVGFIIDTDGTVINAKIVKGVDNYLDDEAMRIVNSMPKWKPGRFEGKLVKTEFTLPINFKLE